jgi:hypothetical protein
VPARVKAFLSHAFPHVPEKSYACYSPEYVHPTRDLFDRFLEDLGARFGAEVVEARPPRRQAPSRAFERHAFLAPAYRAARHLYHGAGRALRKRGIY